MCQECSGCSAGRTNDGLENPNDLVRRSTVVHLAIDLDVLATVLILVIFEVVFL